jgi:hypothetical protein
MAISTNVLINHQRRKRFDATADGKKSLEDCSRCFYGFYKASRLVLDPE